jgi:hypothetical protein
MPPNHGIWSNDGERAAGLRKQVAGPAQNDPVDSQNGIRIGLPRRNTMICCLSTKTSDAARDRNRSMINPKISLNDPTSKGGSSDSPPIANRIRFTIGTG